MSDLSDSPNKARVVHVVLPITIMWREVDELTPETPFFYLGKKKKNVILYIWIGRWYTVKFYPKFGS